MPDDSAQLTETLPGTIRIQVREIPVGGSSPQSVQETFKDLTAEQLQAVGATVGQVQAWLFAKMATAVHKPSSFSIEFGIDVGGEAGIPFVTKGSVRANFKVSMEWKTP